MICNHRAKALDEAGYVKCEYCKTYIAKILPHDKQIQKVIEKHASLYVLNHHESLNLHYHSERLNLLKSYRKYARAVLDFGCGSGEFIGFLKAKGYKAFGYDKSKKILKYLTSNKVLTFKSQAQIPDNYFDVITCFDVIEHVTKPGPLMRIIKRKLKKDGILILSTPNSQGISARFLGGSWWVFGPTAHFVVFSAFSLKILLKQAGFNVLLIRTDTLTPWFTPAERFINKILNKILYLAISPFQKILFNKGLGDNILLVAKNE
jgi:2-polyprenyl-3-methyl-5-hydroxy-6-metoxy-1,4-benzoquinol methylase